MVKAFLLLTSSLMVLTAALRAETPLAGGRVVILSGLPGDVESDRAYQRVLGSLLDALSKAEVKWAAVRLFVHDPEHLDLPAAWREAEVRVGNRENFLALGSELGSSADPVTIVAWGHGGLIRDESVLHVAGPRITAHDFRELGEAAAGAGAPVRWVLYFTGSGSVAGSLAEMGQPVLASENSVRFASDPRGLDLVATEWKADPKASLGTLAHRAGARIAAWYEQRSLARTEEPTLFRRNGEPVLLAESGSAAEAPAEKEPGDWQEIERASPDDYPGADAVVLARRMRYTLGENPAIEAEIEETTQILTTEGKRRGDFDLSFSPPQEDMEFVALEVLRPDGTVEAFDPENVLESKDQSPEGYGEKGSKIFSLRGVEPGSLLHVRYRRVWRRFPFPHVFLELPIADDIPVRRLHIVVEAGKDEAFHARIADAASEEPKVTETSYGRKYEWEWSDLAAARPEMLAPPGGTARLQVSTFPDWTSFVQWYLRLIEQADEITDEIRAAAREVTTGLEKPGEKVRALYEYVTQLRYIAIPLGVNSYRPHSAASVLKNRYGDCKDKSNLLNALVRAEGIEARLVLVPRFSQADESVPGLAFNHAISRVELPDGPLWLDPTDDVCPFGMLPPGDPGRKVLVVAKDSEGLEQLPAPDPKAHRIELELDFREGKMGKGNLRAIGYAGYAMRSAARSAAEYGGTFSLLSAAGLSPVSGVLSTAREKNTAPGEIDRPFTWSAEIERSGAAVPFVLPGSWAYLLQPRTRPAFLNQGYPLEFTQIVRLPMREIPAEASSEGEGALEWKLGWKKEEDSVTGSLQIFLRQPELDGEALDQFRRELRRLYEVLGNLQG